MIRSDVRSWCACCSGRTDFFAWSIEGCIGGRRCRIHAFICLFLLRFPVQYGNAHSFCCEQEWLHAKRYCNNHNNIREQTTTIVISFGVLVTHYHSMDSKRMLHVRRPLLHKTMNTCTMKRRRVQPRSQSCAHADVEATMDEESLMKVECR